MRVTMLLEFPVGYCHLARGIVQIYLLYFFYIYLVKERFNLLKGWSLAVLYIIILTFEPSLDICIIKPYLTKND